MKKRHTNAKFVRLRKVTQTKEDIELNRRIRRINEAISSKELDLLRHLARTDNGFVNDGLRRRAWPLLLHCGKVIDDWDENKAEEHKDERQVLLDVERSLNNYPTGGSYRKLAFLSIRHVVVSWFSDLTPVTKKQKQDDLNDIIVEVLRKYPLLHYYQGYHDVCTCFLIVMGKTNAIPAIENPILRQLTLINTLLKLEDPPVFDFIDEVGVLPYYCLSWILTWCSHDITDFAKVARLFDFFIASNPLMPVYFATAVVLSRRKELLEMEPDNALVHHFLSKFPQDVDVDILVVHAIELEIKFSPEELQRKAGAGLDETSTVNTYATLWSSLQPGDVPSKPDAERILSLPPAERKPSRFGDQGPARNAKERLVLKNRTLWTLLAVGAGMGTAALIMLNNHAMRQWMVDA
ncbi:hypothetical protein BC936DRAFT_143138 [Jimgerdemannia flammicorona]|uniref:Rab-GAP TBC domain-containing protein n=1 Tax=Jimgerdemannia flammicorona TaxID=994334 RepID=A0A433DEC1_9FUNG|nr:hypothetical protein BC936DRAFT_143138 [Jimgerdemannia flammicorona]